LEKAGIFRSRLLECVFENKDFFAVFRFSSVCLPLSVVDCLGDGIRGGQNNRPIVVALKGVAYIGRNQFDMGGVRLKREAEGCD
jgi:hypothetical protein